MSFLRKVAIVADITALSKLKRALSTSEAYTILDEGVEGADTWLSGGCFLLAKVLVKLFPTAKLMVLMGVTKEQEALHFAPQPQHVLVKINNSFVDGDGISSEKSILQRWKKYEGMVGKCWVEAFDANKHKADYIDIANTSAFKKAELKLAEYLSRD
jgi:hypothetical protein